jgi:hypothetical protein
MSPSVRVLSPLASHDHKNGFDAKPAQGKQAIAEQIRGGWAETLERIVQTGNWLIAGKFRKLDYELFSLPFSYSWGRKLQKIARSPRILNPLNRPVLPDKADVLHQIALLSDRLFALGVSEGVINTQCLVVDIKHFRQTFMEPGQCKRRRLTAVYECSPQRNENAREALDAFVSAVQRLAESRFPSISVRRPRRMKELAAS